MKKISIILDEKTMINFPFLWKLLKRYYILALIAPMLVILIGIKSYYDQHEIYSMQQRFKILRKNVDSPSKAITALLGESDTTVTIGEVKGMISSEDFLKDLAENVVNHRRFKELNFNITGRRPLKSWEGIFGDCMGEQSCYVKRVQGRISRFFEIEGIGHFDYSYMLKAQSLDPTTTRILLSEVSEAIVEHRKKTLTHYIKKQQEITKRLLQKEKDKVDFENYINLKNRVELLEDRYREANNEVQLFARLFQSKQHELEYYKSKFKETRDLASKDFDKSELEKSTKVRKLHQDVKDLRADINAIEISYDDLTEGDKEVLEKLVTKLEEKEKKLNSYGNIDKYLSGVHEFAERQMESMNSNKLNYEVYKKQFEELKHLYKAMKEKRKNISMRAKKAESKLEKIKPSFEYMKKLEDKVIQLDFIENTVVTDLRFSKDHSGLKVYKRNSKAKVGLFSIVASAFVFIFVVMLRYAFDGRIYDDFELKANFSDLPIVGRAPTFNTKN